MRRGPIGYEFHVNRESGSCNRKDRRAVSDWLLAHPMVGNLEVGDLCDRAMLDLS
jgi:hypothetical protein